jgi:putative peptidoglycan lipid II flippase
MTLLRAMATLGSWTMASRVLGLVRDILLAGVLGAGVKGTADAFFVAFKFPNFFRRLFAEGAFNAAFVPQFTDTLTRDGDSAARDFGGEVAAVMVSAMLCLLVVAVITMPWLMYAIAPGFADEADKFALTIELTRLTFPYLLFMALAAMIGGMLNAHQRFAATAAAPILLNVVLITVMVLVKLGALALPGHALAWGVAIAGAGQFAWLAFACWSAGIMVRLPRPRLTPGVRKVLRLMVPGVIGAGVVQVNLVIDVILATLLPQGSVSWLYYADRFNQLPLGVIGVAAGVALLPMLSKHLSAGDDAAAMDTQNRAIEFALLLTVPAAAALIAIPGTLVSVVFERGAFTAADTRATAAALMAFAAGLPAYVLIKALAPGFFARQDTKTPVKVAVAAMVLNVAFAVTLMQVIAHAGIALATALSAWINALTLGVLLHRRGFFTTDARLRSRLPRIALAAALMGVALWLLEGMLASPLAGALWQRLGALAVLVIAGFVLYCVLALLFGAARLDELRKGLGRGGTDDDDPNVN